MSPERLVEMKRLINPDDPTLDISRLMEAMDNEKHLVFMILETFLDNWAEALANVEQALERPTREECLRQLHSVKGMFATTGCVQAANYVQALRDEVEEGDRLDIGATRLRNRRVFRLNFDGLRNAPAHPARAVL